MSATNDIPSLERPAFFAGQRLTAEDLISAQTLNRELRWLHNRSLHSWGIAFGYEVIGTRGARSIRVAPGYALDCRGRDLILSEPLDIAVPAESGKADGSPATYFLTVSYVEDDDLDAVTRAGICGASGAVRRPEQPLVRWQDADRQGTANDYNVGLDVVLCAIEVQNCRLNRDVSTEERRDALPPQQPYIAAGQTKEGETKWDLWPDEQSALGVKTTVDTSAAGFQTMPCYQAHVVGKRVGHHEQGSASFDFVVDGYVQITPATASEFDLYVYLPSGLTSATVLQKDLDLVWDNAIKPYTIISDEEIAMIDRLIKSGTWPEKSAPNSKAYKNVKVLSFDRSKAYAGQIINYEVTFSYYEKDKDEDEKEFTSDAKAVHLTLEATHFKDALEQIASRLQTEVNILTSMNGFNDTFVSLDVNAPLIIPGPRGFNPPEVRTQSYLKTLETELKWHVVWMGIEG